MASETARTLNGSYTGQIPAEVPVQPSAPNSMVGSTSSAEPASTPSTGNTTSSSAGDSSSSVPKDEVGWYFVEQYYTTLSKNPEKLHVSQDSFLSGRANCGY